MYLIEHMFYTQNKIVWILAKVTRIFLLVIRLQDLRNTDLEFIGFLHILILKNPFSHALNQLIQVFLLFWEYFLHVLTILDLVWILHHFYDLLKPILNK